jgi:hypothetical protein
VFLWDDDDGDDDDDVLEREFFESQDLPRGLVIGAGAGRPVQGA